MPYDKCTVSAREYLHFSSNGIITLLLSVDGGYSSWGTWSKCSRSCGIGFQLRSRTRTNPAPKFGGKTCYQHRRLGQARQRRMCNRNVNCPGNKITISIFHGVLSERLKIKTCTLLRRSPKLSNCQASWEPKYFHLS